MGNTAATDFLPTNAGQDDGVRVLYRGGGRWRYWWKVRCSVDPGCRPERLQTSYVTAITAERVALGTAAIKTSCSFRTGVRTKTRRFRLTRRRGCGAPQVF